ncbi:hypothetical protein EPD60_06230 [Flaviaesturariibacter flavus]|uniref:Uncharacterized protein n=1 Tax=Flaviaesturariibacter flavus TaxID=2502780 RepID=A0A4V2NWL4_9BACT|nr:hypothetical protein [Flaviaesturariibacter flavus]TCJ17782.1 hypothetical protein EPD60_06230 [Flaviaesturariibacter flavus]
MNNLFDLRFVIGAFFTITGLMLFVYSFVDRQAINHWCGLLFFVFGVVMILLSRFKPVRDPNVPDEL